ncbi:MAG: hypothetical protein QOG19_123, partial [Mycobacterium sp.]|nr:hypothetical protein [Mycobacterium sp.]
MDVVLGVAVTGRVARLALVEAAAHGDAVIDQSTVDLAGNPVAELSETIVGTSRLLADEGHRLVATRLCWSDRYRADQVKQALDYARVPNVAVVSESQAATALLGPGRAGAAVLLVGSEMASLAVSGDPDAPPTVMAATPVEGDAGATFDTLMAQVPRHAGTPNDVLVVGTSSENTAMFANQLQSASTMSVQVPSDSDFALARGAAADATTVAPAIPADATMAAPIVSPQGGAAAPFVSSQGGGMSAPTSSPDGGLASAQGGGMGAPPSSSPDGGVLSSQGGGMGAPPSSSPDGGVLSSQGGGMGGPTSSPDGGASFHSL